MSHLQRLVQSASGVAKYVSNVSSLGYLSPKKLNDVMIEFLKSKNIEYKRWSKKYRGLFTADLINASIVQKEENWNDFKKFIRTNYPNEQVKNKQQNPTQ